MHMSWCLKNDIKVYVVPTTYPYVKMVIEEKGKKYSKDEYYRQPTKKHPIKKNESKWWVEVMKMYTELYLKNNK